MLTIFYPYLGIVAVLIVIVLLANEIGMRKSERGDFKKKIIQEALAIVDHIIWSTSASHISCANWTTKAEGFKVDLLGDRDYGLWKQFYDSVGRRNEYLESRGTFGLWENFAKLNRTIFDNFFEVYDEISWVKESVPKERITDFLSRAKKSACL
jgi:hypothetical protein